MKCERISKRLRIRHGCHKKCLEPIARDFHTLLSRGLNLYRLSWLIFHGSLRLATSTRPASFSRNHTSPPSFLPLFLSTSNPVLDWRDSLYLSVISLFKAMRRRIACPFSL